VTKQQRHRLEVDGQYKIWSVKFPQFRWQFLGTAGYLPSHTTHEASSISLAANKFVLILSVIVIIVIIIIISQTFRT